VFMLYDDTPMQTTDALQATLNSLPEELVKEVELDVNEDAGVRTAEKMLEVIREQQELIADEREQSEKDEAEWKAEQNRIDQEAKMAEAQVIKDAGQESESAGSDQQSSEQQKSAAESKIADPNTAPVERPGNQTTTPTQ